MKLFWLFFLVCPAAWAQVRSAPRSVEDTTGRLVTLETTACRGTCPVQVLTVFSDGLAVYEGRQHTDRTGRYERRLSKKEAQALVKQFRDARFFDFKDSYQEKVTDLPTTYLTFSDNGRTKTVLDYFGTPVAVKKLEQAVLALLEKKGWKPVKGYRGNFHH